MSKVNEDALKAELSKHNYISINSIEQNGPGNFEVNADKLHPVKIGNEDPLYVKVPVSLSVTLNDANKVEKIEESAENTGAYNSAEKFVETLVANNQLQGLSDTSNNRWTHKIEINNNGQKVIKRTRAY